jgi:hypothetical protein
MIKNVFNNIVQVFPFRKGSANPLDERYLLIYKHIALKLRIVFDIKSIAEKQKLRLAEWFVFYLSRAGESVFH